MNARQRTELERRLAQAVKYLDGNISWHKVLVYPDPDLRDVDRDGWVFDQIDTAFDGICTHGGRWGWVNNREKG